MADDVKRDALDRWLDGSGTVAEESATPHPAPVVDGSGSLSAAEVLGIDDVWLLEQAKAVLVEAMLVEDGVGLATARATVELLMRVTGMLDQRSTVEHSGGIDIRIVGVDIDQMR